MLRSFFLLLSRNRSLRHYFETSRSAASLTKRFVAGNTLDEGMQVNGQLAGRGMFVALDHLGENVSSEAEAALAAQEIVAALDRIGRAATNTTVAIKLTQFGLDQGQRH